MKVSVAPRAGFCFGVKNAFDKALKVTEEGGQWSMLGYLVHNQDVVRYLASRGIRCVSSVEEAEPGGVIIRTHGVPPQVTAEAEARGLKVLDATCPRVRRVQQLAADLSSQQYSVIILGHEEHAEVVGIKGYAGDKAVVVDSVEAAGTIHVPDPDKVALLSQTTRSEEEFAEVAGVLRKRFPALKVFNTICPETRKRQEEALHLARNSDIMLVVGDVKSSNTQVLAQICKDAGVSTYLVGSADDIDSAWFKGARRVGITAGASTPDWTIKEVIVGMTGFDEEAMASNAEVKKEGEASFMDMEAEMAESYLKPIQKGDIVSGTVVQVDDNEVLVDVGGKSEGVIPVRELSVRDVGSAKDIVKVGDPIEVVVLRWDDDGTILLSKKRVDMKKAFDKLEEAFENGQNVTGTVVKAIKGGLMVDVGVMAFLPASHIDEGFVRDVEKYVGETMEFRIIEFNRNKRRGSQVVVSRKVVLEEEKQKKSEAFWASVEEGQVRRGRVKRLTSYGAFVDLGGFEGLLHISEMDYGRVDKPSDILSEGDEIDVMVLGADPEKARVSLSRKRILKDPWETVAERYQVGDVVSGKVVRLAPFGAFVELEPGVDGLVHISQLAQRRIEKPEDVVSAGQEVSVKVLGVDPEEKRISLSIKQVEQEADRETMEEYMQTEE